jgi:hypothetical protein
LPSLRVRAVALRRFFGLLAVLAIFFNAVAPFAHRPGAATSGGNAAFSLCTALGFVVPNDEQTPSSPAKLPFSYCPICAAAQLASAFVPPLTPALSAPALMGEATFVRPVEAAASTITTHRFGARAPPSLV